MPGRDLRPRASKMVVRVLPPVRRLVEQRDGARRRLAAADSRLVRLVEQRDTARRLLAAADSRLIELREENAQLQANVLRKKDVDSQSSADQIGYLFVVTYGRSGSTLLQGILNSIPGYLIRGENHDAVYRLFKYHSTVVAASNRKWSRPLLGTEHPWFGVDEYPEAVSIAHLRSLLLDALLRPKPGTRVTGFKEIRWFHDDWMEYFDFLEQVFPQMRILINTRNHEDVSRSKWWAEMDNSAEVLSRYEARLDAIEARFGERAFRVHYDEWSADPSRLEGMYEWLGERFELGHVKSVMSVKHSY